MTVRELIRKLQQQCPDKDAVVLFIAPAMVMEERLADDGRSKELAAVQIAMALKPIAHLLSDERLVDSQGKRMVLLTEDPSTYQTD